MTSAVGLDEIVFLLSILSVVTISIFLGMMMTP